MFIVFDGIDGAGKSTQLTLAADWLNAGGHSVVSCFDPGSTALGAALRHVLLEHEGIPIDPMSEMLLFTAARAQLVSEVVRPALAEGQFVLCDRYIFSTAVYQGHAGGLDADEIWQVNRMAVGGLMPELTLIFDLPAAESFRRLSRNLDRLESRGSAYFDRVREGFLLEAQRWPDRIKVLDADRPVEAIQQDVRAALTAQLERCAR